MSDTSFAQLAALAIEHLEARRKDAKRGWRERHKQLVTIAARAAEAKAHNIPLRIEPREHRLLFNPCEGL